MAIKDQKSYEEINLNNATRSVILENSNKKEFGIKATDENKAFLSIISHNIKNPFGALLGYADLILDDYGDLTDSEKKHYLNDIRDIANFTSKYIEHFFEWMYYKTGKMDIKFEYLSLNELIHSCAKKVILENKFLGEVQFNLTPEILIYADMCSISKVICTIIENSTRYAADKAKISIETYNEDGFVNIRIADNGKGINSELLSKLFDKSQNVNLLQNNKRNGSGLGLILAKELIELNNGFISITSKPKKGTDVKLVLPVLNNF